MPIVSGQRWMSLAEPELGLGAVTAADVRQVTLHFSASLETRSYALASAPIKRVVLRKGERLTTAQHKNLIIDRVEEIEHLFYYQCGSLLIPENELNQITSLTTADRRLLDGRVDSTQLFSLRRRAWHYRRTIQQHPAHGYLGARMDLIPHQLYIAHEVAERRCPRVLLSDEVGLGKTIEACLILHRLYVRGQSGRVLILVPEALIHQWFVELYRRFNLTCAIFDEARCVSIQAQTALEGSSLNPFLDEHLVLTSTALFKKHPERLEQALAADWGLVIVDEAHHLKWSTQEVSVEYKMVEAFSKLTRSLLLLTGTPEQFGLEGHFARLRLLDPERYPHYETFRKETEHYHKIAGKVEELLDGKKFTGKNLDSLRKLFSKREDLDNALHHLEKGADLDQTLREVLVEDLLDRHGTGRAVFRNTRAAIPGFPKRRVYPAALALPASQEDAAEIVQHEMDFELGLVETLGRKKLDKDPRVDWVVKLLKKFPEEKFLLICRYQKRAETLYETLRTKTNASMTVFHEEQTILQRDRNAAWFAQPAPGGARLLICSEIGSEGRNFQFAHHCILYDLPLEPELLEQRIGRLDRIGQRETIHLHVPYFKETSGESLFQWVHEGLGAFTHPVQGGALQVEKFQVRLRNLLTKEGRAKQKKGALESLVSETSCYRQELEKRFAQGRDRLLEWHSCRLEKIAPLIADIRALDAKPELADFLLAALDHFGVHVEMLGQHDGLRSKSNRSWLLMSGPLMLEQITFIPPEGRMITFDRAIALDRDDVEFITWDHPIVTSLLDLLLGSETGNAAFSEGKATPLLKAGLFVEMVFLLEPVSPPRYDLNRFLPATSLRVLVNSKAEVLLDHGVEELDKILFVDAVKHALAGQSEGLKPFLEMLQKRGHEVAEKQAADLRNRASIEMTQSLTRELARLDALQSEKNKSKHVERELLQEELLVLSEALEQSRTRLDAVRLIRLS